MSNMAIKNRMSDLNNHLFAEIERLGDEDLKGDALKEEIERAEALTKVSGQIINNGALALKAEVIKTNSLGANSKLPDFLELEDKKA